MYYKKKEEYDFRVPREYKAYLAFREKLNEMGVKYIEENAGDTGAGMIMKKERRSFMNILSSLLYFLLSRSRKITITTTEPTDADGSNGDIWLVYEASDDDEE